MTDQYNPDQEVKDIKATLLVKMTFSTTLLGIDYMESDGTDEGAFKSALDEIGFDGWDTAEIHSILSIKDEASRV